jgi:two-component system, OmpR family, response regulator
MSRILVVDDDPHLREVVRYALTREGHSVKDVEDGRKALSALGSERFDLVILDILMPEMDGLETCRQIRRTSKIPVIFLSSRDEELDRVLGLEMGGDDYITKPFGTRELTARVKAVLRRSQPEPEATKEEAVLQLGSLRMDPTAHRVWVGDKEVVLTVTEFSILKVLLGRPGRVYTREELTDRAYGEGHHLAERTLDSHIRRIRQKLRDEGIDPVETVHGLGYRLQT